MEGEHYTMRVLEHEIEVERKKVRNHLFPHSKALANSGALELDRGGLTMQVNLQVVRQSEREFAKKAAPRSLQIERPTRTHLSKGAPKNQLEFLQTTGGREYYLYRPSAEQRGHIVWRVPDIREAFGAGPRFRVIKADYSQIGGIAGKLSPDPSPNQSIQNSCGDILKVALNKIFLAFHGGKPDGEDLYGVYFMLDMHDGIAIVAPEDRAEAVVKIMKDCMLEAYNDFVKPPTHDPMEVTISDRRKEE
jgi:hypothetical protein